MQLWGGLECSIARVGDHRYDQLARCGHYERADDLDLVASLGITTLRYPLLWERIATAPGEYDWRFADERLTRMRELGIRPIVGLVHHGCGPAWTHLLDDGFASGLADYAGKVARRYPWVQWYTPVNEPLTTARFSGLYGHWHPHSRNARDFVRILLNECRATVLAMQAIRAVNPAAKLAQTDDLGTIYSTAPLDYQAEHENERRWLGWDLLLGRVDVTHPMHGYLLGNGIGDRDLAWFREQRCGPDLIGIDHYVTSDRFLDHRLERYPPCTHGGNGRDRYADVEAVRVLERPGTSLRHLVMEAARRYRLPIALTEVHIGCDDVEEQVRWLHEAWAICEQLAASGVPVQAVTAWALFGSYDWNTMMTRGGNTYESGAFCLRGGAPRPTRLADYIRIRTGRSPALPLVDTGQGWWHRPERLLHGPGLPCTASGHLRENIPFTFAGGTTAREAHP